MSSNNENKGKKRSKFVFWMFILGGVLGLILSLGIAQGVHMTGDAKFCVTCHSSMDFAVKSYYESSHGGANKAGFEAECNACHLPHDNVANYLYKKVTISMHDIRVQWFGDVKDIDWEAKREEVARHAVYDSGCKSCHVNLQDVTMSTPKGFIAHRDYFRGKTDKHCAECHRDVGHKNLGHFITAQNLQKKEQ